MKKEKTGEKVKQASTIHNMAEAMGAWVRRYPEAKILLPLDVLVGLIVPLLYAMITSVAIAGIERGDALYFVCSISAILLVYWLLQLFREIVGMRFRSQRVYTRIQHFFRKFIHKGITTDYMNMEPQPRQKKVEKASRALSSNWVGAERLMQESVDFVIRALGLISFGSALLLLDYKVVLAVFAMLLFDVLFRFHAIHYSDAHRDENADVYRRQNYLRRTSMNVATGKDIRIYQMKGWFNTVYDKLIKEGERIEKKTQLRWFFPTVSDAIAGFARNAIAYAILVSKVMNQEMDLAIFTLYIGVINGFSDWIYGMSENIHNLIKSSHEMNDYNEFLHTPEIFTHEDGLAMKNGPSVAPTVSFHNVTFCYEGSDKKILSNLNLDIKAGERVALVGMNGAGKTTIVKILSGLYAPTAGEVLIDGQNIMDLNIEEYQDRVSALFQDVVPMSFTIAMNVAGCSERLLDRERVRMCLKKAGLWEKIESLPDKEDTFISQVFEESGIQLSGGEVQKLLLARALYKGGSLLILDEPTAALDPLAESKIYEEYNSMSQGKTVLFISHRLASTKFCDRILFLENGVVIESGTHKELMEQNGKYKEMFDIQSQYYYEREGADDEEQ